MSPCRFLAGGTWWCHVCYGLTPADRERCRGCGHTRCPEAAPAPPPAPARRGAVAALLAVAAGAAPDPTDLGVIECPLCGCPLSADGDTIPDHRERGSSSDPPCPASGTKKP